MVPGAAAEAERHAKRVRLAGPTRSLHKRVSAPIASVRWSLRCDLVGLRVNLRRASACDLQMLMRKLRATRGGTAHGPVLGRDTAVFLVRREDQEGVVTLLRRFVAEDGPDGAPAEQLFSWEVTELAQLRKAEVAECLVAALKRQTAWTWAGGRLYNYCGGQWGARRFCSIELGEAVLSSTGVLDIACTAGVLSHVDVSLATLLPPRLQGAFAAGKYVDMEYEEELDRSCVILPTLQRSLIQGVCKAPVVYDAATQRHTPAAVADASALAAKINKRFEHHFSIDPSTLGSGGVPHYFLVSYPHAFCTTSFEPWQQLGFVVPSTVVRYAVAPLPAAAEELAGAVAKFRADALVQCRCLT